MSSSRQGTLPQTQPQAEIIDLIQLPVGTRPTPIAYLNYDEVDNCRAMDCFHYQSCLAFAARVRWKSFHCRQCPKHPNAAPEAPRDLESTAAIIKLR